MTVSDWIGASIIVLLEVMGVGMVIADVSKARAKRRRSRGQAAIEIARIEADANESVDRLQHALWQAQRMMRDERCRQ